MTVPTGLLVDLAHERRPSSTGMPSTPASGR